MINTSIAGNKESIKSAGEIKKSVVSKKIKRWMKRIKSITPWNLKIVKM